MWGGQGGAPWSLRVGAGGLLQGEPGTWHWGATEVVEREPHRAACGGRSLQAGEEMELLLPGPRAEAGGSVHAAPCPEGAHGGAGLDQNSLGWTGYRWCQGHVEETLNPSTTAPERASFSRALPGTRGVSLPGCWTAPAKPRGVRAPAQLRRAGEGALLSPVTLALLEVTSGSNRCR